jgi:hypothetical protein
VVLRDGRIGKISRVDTFFPKAETVVTVWLKDHAADSSAGPPQSSSTTGLVKVSLDEVVGTAARPELV